MALERGYVQVYTGDGKGKTTAALGLALRAVGSGLRVFMGQFVKGRDFSELRSIRDALPAIAVKQFGSPAFICGEPSAQDVAMAQAGLAESRQAMLSGNYDLVILDEANVATDLKLIAVEDLLALIDSKPPRVELVITGRRAAPAIVARADLVTEMRDVKHYYSHGVSARTGIEQ